jgi:TPR repeat protein
LEQAETYFQLAKEKEYPRAICDLGVFYLNFPDYSSKYNSKPANENALTNFQLAKEMGNVQAYYYLGQCYEKG